MMKGRYPKAFQSLRRLRHTDLQAARDLYCTFLLLVYIDVQFTHLIIPHTDIHVLLEAEKEVNLKTRNKFLELFTIPRNRRATLASSIVMFMYVPDYPHPLRDLLTWDSCRPTGNSSAA